MARSFWMLIGAVAAILLIGWIVLINVPPRTPENQSPPIIPPATDAPASDPPATGPRSP